MKLLLENINNKNPFEVHKYTSSQDGLKTIYNKALKLAKNRNLDISPNKELIFVNKGCINTKCRELGLPVWSIRNSASVFEKTGKLFRVQKSDARGWSSVKFKSLSDNPFVCNNGQSAAKPDSKDQERSTTIESIAANGSEEASRVESKPMTLEAVS